jgi:hypothetical protein
MNCASVPVDIQRSLKKKRTNSIAFVDTVSSVVDTATTDQSVTSKTAPSVQQWVDRVNSEENEKLDELLGNIFYQTGIPFRLADHNSFKQFVQRLRPAYTMPSAKRIAGGLLKDAHGKLANELNVVLSDTNYIHIVTDGWSSLRRISTWHVNSRS